MEPIGKKIPIAEMKSASLIDGQLVWPELRYLSTKGAECKWTLMLSMKTTPPAKPSTINISEDMFQPGYDFTNLAVYAVTVSGQIGGKIRNTVPTVYRSGKNIGKSNATTVLTQAINETESKYLKQKKKAQPTLPLPMLASAWDGQINDEVIVQRKLDGVHCVATFTDKISIYSRSGKPFRNLGSALISGIEYTFKYLIPEYAGLKGLHLVGEIYLHGIVLSKIVGQLGRSEERESDYPLEFHIFDAFWFDHDQVSDTPTESRQEFLDILFDYINAETTPEVGRVKRVECFSVKNVKELNRLYNKFIAEGYEGCIIRKLGEPYILSTNGYHSSVIQKRKAIHDDEFPVVGFKNGTGKNENTVTWVCETKDGQQFAVEPSLPAAVREKVFLILKTHKEAFDLIRGKMLTVEYSGLSVNNIPVQGKGKSFRTQDSGESDPLTDLIDQYDETTQ